MQPCGMRIASSLGCSLRKHTRSVSKTEFGVKINLDREHVSSELNTENPATIIYHIPMNYCY